MHSSGRAPRDPLLKCHSEPTSRGRAHARPVSARKAKPVDFIEGTETRRDNSHLHVAGTTFTNNVVGAGSRKSFPDAPASSRGKRLRVAVDVDEVLGRFLHSLNQYCLEEFGWQYEVADYKEYNFAKIWGCTRDEANERVHKFFQSRHFAAGILPIPGALHSLQRLKDSCDLVVVTSRQHVIQQPTLQWIQMHFPDIFAEVHFGNHWALVGDSRKKSEICRDIGAAVLIDDNPAYAMDCAEAGMQVLLYDWRLEYPWAKTADGPSHPLIQRVKDWEEVESQLLSLSARSLS